MSWLAAWSNLFAIKWKINVQCSIVICIISTFRLLILIECDAQYHLKESNTFAQFPPETGDCIARPITCMIALHVECERHSYECNEFESTTLWLSFETNTNTCAHTSCKSHSPLIYAICEQFAAAAADSSILSCLATQSDFRLRKFRDICLSLSVSERMHAHVYVWSKACTVNALSVSP